MSDPRTPSPCRYCGADILWAANERSGKPMPFDAVPDSTLSRGWQLFIRSGKGMARYIRERNDELLRRPHFETCTNYKPGTVRAPETDRTERTRESLERAQPGARAFFASQRGMDE